MSDRYVIISADAHAGLPCEEYRPYLDERYHGAFDEILAWSIVHAGYPGMTGRLTIRYRKPTPVGVPVEFRVEPPRVAGKVVHVHGTLTAGDAITAEADGLFVHFQGKSDAVPFMQGRDFGFPDPSAAQEG